MAPHGLSSQSLWDFWERVPLKFRAKKFAGPSGRNSDADSGDEAPEARKAGFSSVCFVR